MSRPYIRSHYGDNCFFRDSSLKRYNRYHSGGDTLIFNYNYGCNNSHGHCGGSFWGGFGSGIGFGLANMFSGLFGMFGCGMNMFGGGFPSWGQSWGNWGNSGYGYGTMSTTPSTSTSGTKKTTGADTKKSDTDAQKILDIIPKAVDISNLTDAQIDGLIKKLEDLKDKLDGINDDTNKTNIDSQIELLKNQKAKNAQAKDNASAKPADNNNQANGASGGAATDDTSGSNPTAPTGNNNHESISKFNLEVVQTIPNPLVISGIVDASGRVKSFLAAGITKVGDFEVGSNKKVQPSKCNNTITTNQDGTITLENGNNSVTYSKLDNPMDDDGNTREGIWYQSQSERGLGQIYQLVYDKSADKYYLIQGSWQNNSGFGKADQP